MMTQLKSDLLALMNVGPATLKDLHRLGIERIDQLKGQNPEELYQRLQQITGVKHDPCVWDVFATIIHEAETGEKRPWWYWSRIRKKILS
jgi:nucleotidyltransferase/DNA polymerase involved in DNA repair